MRAGDCEGLKNEVIGDAITDLAQRLVTEKLRGLQRQQQCSRGFSDPASQFCVGIRHAQAPFRTKLTINSAASSGVSLLVSILISAFTGGS